MFRALGVSAIMRYINRRFTYLLTYLVIKSKAEVTGNKKTALEVC